MVRLLGIVPLQRAFIGSFEETHCKDRCAWVTGWGTTPIIDFRLPWPDSQRNRDLLRPPDGHPFSFYGEQKLHDKHKRLHGKFVLGQGSYETVARQVFCVIWR